ncbi:hypothetical protein FRB95_010330 [Tulasnella sp. JGI-2019a]|nr:hypothetical protein FRB95_010330 [Tulasnella sp. JGI-2019a]
MADTKTKIESSHPKYAITCHCGAAAQKVSRRPAQPIPGAAPPLNLCHCTNCRHNTGLLCVSYMRIDEPPSTQGLLVYQATPGFHRYFCGKCGCHVFWNKTEDPVTGQGVWAVATGVVTGRADVDGEGAIGEGDEGKRLLEPQYARHTNTAGTKDGGLSIFMPNINGQKMEIFPHWGDELVDDSSSSSSQTSPIASTEGELPASCHCKNVRFHITRPDAASRLPKSGFADLILPFHTQSPQIPNPDDEKWWLREGAADGKTRYLAGTCACRSCRLISGHEIQTWAFVPRSNIHFHVPASSGVAAGGKEESPRQAGKGEGEVVIPLDFATLPPGILKSYESSPGVVREFCPTCGATIFWHDRWRPELIDVSVGLLDAEEGARAESWLEWWRGRVSFVEDAGLGRTGDVAARAKGLFESLEKGLKSVR